MTLRPHDKNTRAQKALETGKHRIIVARTIFAALFVVLAGRVVDLSVLNAPKHPPRLTQSAAQDQDGPRADIYDRNGVLIATSLPTSSLFVDSKSFLKSGEDPTMAARKLASVLPDLDLDDTVRRLTSGKRFDYIRRSLTPNQKYQVNRLGIPALDYKREERRTYPHGPLLAHVLGYTDVDGRGISGLEKTFNHQLDESGAPLTLSLDVRLQAIVRDALQQTITEFKAIGGAGVLMDIHTGEVLSLVSLPDFDPNDTNTLVSNVGFNRATKGVYEMGSIFKLLNTAMALDHDVVQLTDRFDTSKPLRVGRFQITDYRGQDRVLTVPEVLIYSSNIGSAQIALEAGTQTQRAFLKRMGLLQAASLELPEVAYPLYPTTWRDANTMTISYGHGIAVSPLQLVNAIAALANGGLLQTPTLLKAGPKDTRLPAKRVIQTKTSETILKLMRLVVLQGSGKKANSNFYHVGGKTGTADKQQNGRYNERVRISSFAGVFPLDNPRYALIAMVDEPQGIKRTFGFATAGWVAAPIMQQVVDRAAPLLGLPPSRNEDPIYEKGDALYISVKDKD